jgi:NRE family putative nickel resistance protein-like MFS transporter
MADPSPGTTAPAGYLTILRGNRNFRLLWSGEVVSLFGDWFNLIASAALISYLTQSGLAVGGLFVVRMLAPFIISPFAGVAADRFNRKHLLVAADLARALVVLGFLFVRDPQQVWALYALTAIQLGISGFFFPARNALLPDIVNRAELGGANALSSATWSVMLALGAAMGGLVAGQWGIYPAFIIDSITFFISALLIARIAYQPAIIEAVKGISLSSATAQYLEGLSYLKDHPDVLSIALHKSAIALTVGGGFQVVQVALAEKVFVIGEGGGTSLGILYAVAGVGTGLGPLIARRFSGDRELILRKLLMLSYILSVGGLVIGAQLTNFQVVLIGSLIRTAGGGLNWVFSTQLLLQLLPDRVRGRVFSSEFALFTLTNAMGAAAAGGLLDSTQLGIRGLIWLMAGLTVIPGLLWTYWITAGKNTYLSQIEGSPPGNKGISPYPK